MNKPGTIIAVADTRMHPTHFLGRKGNLLFHDPSTDAIEPLPLLEDAAPTWNHWKGDVPAAEVNAMGFVESQEYSPNVDAELLRRSLETRAAIAGRTDLVLLINTLGGTRWVKNFVSDIAAFSHATGGQVRAYVTSAAVSSGFLLAQQADILQVHPRAFLAHHEGSPGKGTLEYYMEKFGPEEAERRMTKLTSIARALYEETMASFVGRAHPLGRSAIQRRFDDAAATSPDRWASFDGEALFDAGIADVLADKSMGIARDVGEDTNRSPNELTAIPSIDRFFRHSRLEGMLRRQRGLYGCTVRHDGREKPFLMPNNELYATMDRSLLKEANDILGKELS